MSGRPEEGGGIPSRRGPAIHVRKLGAAYGGRPVLADVSLDVAPGELLALIGPSGSGKSTLLRCLAGFLDPAAGELCIGDEVVSTPERSVTPERRQIGYVFQAHALWPHMTALDNVAYPWKVRGVPTSERRSRAEALLARVDLAGLALRRPSELSGGERQRVALARALAGEPRILLLDEPFSSVDVMVRDELLALLRGLVAESGLTTIFTTHDQHEATALADRVAVLVDGRLVQVGTPQGVYEAPVASFVARFMGPANLVGVEVVARLPDAVAVRPAGAGALDAAILVPGTTCTADEAVLMVRPEHVELVPSSGTAPLGEAWESEVLRVRPRGPATEVEVRAAGATWLATRRETDLVPGDRVHLRLDRALLLAR